MSNLSDKILEKIKTKHIAPKPRWQFLLQQWLVWIFTSLSIMIGSFSFSVMIFNLVNNDWEFIKLLNRSPLQHLFNTLPYVWIVILILFVGLAYYNARHTKGSYKYQAYWFVIGSIVISMAMGSIFYAFGLAPRVHMAAQKLPFLKELMHDRDKIWMNIEGGFIAGEVTGMRSGIGMFELEDLENNFWIVRPGEKFYPPPPDFIIEEGVMLRVYGQKINSEIFEAYKITPYQIGPGIEKGRFPGKLKDFRSQHNYIHKKSPLL